jgi:hypothetical protein
MSDRIAEGPAGTISCGEFGLARIRRELKIHRRLECLLTGEVVGRKELVR